VRRREGGSVTAAASWRRELALRLLLPAVAVACGALIAAGLVPLLRSATDAPAGLPAGALGALAKRSATIGTQPSDRNVPPRDAPRSTLAPTDP
jgi:hypothetical protein